MNPELVPGVAHVGVPICLWEKVRYTYNLKITVVGTCCADLLSVTVFEHDSVCTLVLDQPERGLIRIAHEHRGDVSFVFGRHDRKIESPRDYQPGVLASYS